MLLVSVEEEKRKLKENTEIILQKYEEDVIKYNQLKVKYDKIKKLFEKIDKKLNSISQIHNQIKLDYKRINPSSNVIHFPSYEMEMFRAKISKQLEQITIDKMSLQSDILMFEYLNKFYNIKSIVNNSKKETQISFLDLPDEIIIKILSNCDSLLFIKQTCKELNEIVNKNFDLKPKDLNVFFTNYSNLSIQPERNTRYIMNSEIEDIFNINSRGYDKKIFYTQIDITYMKYNLKIFDLLIFDKYLYIKFSYGKIYKLINDRPFLIYNYPILYDGKMIINIYLILIKLTTLSLKSYYSLSDIKYENIFKTDYFLYMKHSNCYYSFYIKNMHQKDWSNDSDLIEKTEKLKDENDYISALNLELDNRIINYQSQVVMNF